MLRAVRLRFVGVLGIAVWAIIDGAGRLDSEVPKTWI